MVKVEKFTVNYQENPTGITYPQQIGWVISASERNMRQEAYRLQMAGDEAFAQILYDSGRVESEESAHVRFDGEALTLASGTRYYIRVKTEITDRAQGLKKEESEWYGGTFVTALLSPDEWQAGFVTAESREDRDESRGSYLRKEFTVPKKPVRAYVYATALGLYQLYINGTRVGADEFTPGWTSYRKHLLYQMYDVSGLLREGENVVGALVGAGWYKGTMGFMRMRNHYGERAAFAAQLELVYADGSKERVITDESWQGAFGPILFSEIYDGEIYDAAKEIEDWSRADCAFDGWKRVESVPFDRSVLQPQSGCKVKIMTKVPARQIFTTPQGDRVVDFGQNMTGWVDFRVKGNAGDRVVLHFFEVLNKDGNVYLDNLRSAKQTVTYICKDSEEVRFHPHFTYQGFQYMRIAEYPGEPKAEDFVACAVHSDMAETGSLTCSNPDLNQLMHNVKWGMKGNFLDVPTDCPQRDERLGWTGDAQIFCRTATCLMDTYTFYRKWLRDVAADQTKEGGVPHVVPDLLIGKSSGDRLMKDGDHSAAAWADVAVILPWTLYLMYGDRTVIEDQYDSMRAWIEFMRRHSRNHIWNYKLQFGDWVALDAEEGSYFGATPNDLTCTAYYAYSTGLFVKMAEIVGRKRDADEYRRLYEEIVATFRHTFFGSDGHMTVQTQTAQIVALYFGLAPRESRQTVVDDLLRLLEKENGHLVTGFVGTPYFCHALSQNGHTREAYELLLKEDFPSWLYQVKMGATTVWEHWDGLKPDGSMWSPDMNSFNHYAYGAIGEWLYRVAAGIECQEEAPGFKHSRIMPHIGGGLSFLRASYRSIYGRIRVEWEVKEDRDGEADEVTLSVEIPCNTSATIVLPQALGITDADGLAFAAGEEGPAAEAGSGRYVIRYRSR